MRQRNAITYGLLIGAIVLLSFLSGLISCSRNALTDSKSDNSVLSTPGIIGNIEVGSCKKVFAGDSRAFIIDSHYGVHIINLDNKSQPEIEKSIRTPQPNDLWLIDDTIYISDYIRGIIIADISDIKNPVIVNEINSPNQTFSIYCDEAHLFVTTQYTYYEKKYSNLIIYDINQRQNPEKVNEFERLPWINDVFIEKDYAYLTYDDSSNNSTGLIIMDISDIKNPGFTGKIETGGFAINAIVEKDHVFLADDTAGLQIIDVSSKERPYIISTLEVDDHATDVKLHERYAYVSDGYNGIKKVDIGDPGHPETVDELETLGFAKDLFIYDDFIYVADSRYFTIIEKF